MTEALAQGLLVGLAVYAAFGALFGVVFLSVAVQRLDPAAVGMPWAARALVLPGVTALWPLLAWRWLRRQSPPVA